MLLADGFRTSPHGPLLRVTHNMAANITTSDPRQHKREAKELLWLNHIKPLLPNSIRWKWVSKSSLQLRGGELASTFSKEECQRFVDLFQNCLAYRLGDCRSILGERCHGLNQGRSLLKIIITGMARRCSELWRVRSQLVGVALDTGPEPPPPANRKRVTSNQWSPGTFGCNRFL